MLSLSRVLLAGCLVFLACGKSEKTLGSGNDTGGTGVLGGDEGGMVGLGGEFDGGSGSGGRASGGGSDQIGGASNGGSGAQGAMVSASGSTAPTGGTGASGGRSDVSMGARSGTALCSLPEHVQIITPEDYDVTTAGYESAESCRKREPEMEAEAAALLESAELSVAPLAGTWTEGVGDERIELTLDERGEGSLMFGEFAELPEIEDPRAAYLIDVGPSELINPTMERSNDWFRAGFRYRVVPKNGRASEMTFAVFVSEPWSEWCALQKPVLGRECFACELLLTGAYFVGEECGDKSGCHQQDVSLAQNIVVQTDCGRYTLCTKVCSCTEDSCTNSAWEPILYRVTIDPVDVTVLRFGIEGSMPDHYLVRED